MNIRKIANQPNFDFDTRLFRHYTFTNKANNTWNIDTCDSIAMYKSQFVSGLINNRSF